jgi:hypothetical protein
MPNVGSAQISARTAEYLTIFSCDARLDADEDESGCVWSRAVEDSRRSVIVDALNRHYPRDLPLSFSVVSG